jgi:hypothetical protein
MGQSIFMHTAQVGVSHVEDAHGSQSLEYSTTEAAHMELMH